MEISIIKDLLRGTPHVVVARTGDSILAKSVTEFGAGIAMAIQTNGKINHKGLPDGFGATDFKHVSDNIANMVLETYVDPEIERIKLINKASSSQTAKSHNERNVIMRSRLRMSSSAVPIRLANSVDSKLNLIDYKASKFVTTSSLGSVVATLNSNKISFDSNKNILVAKKDDPMSNAIIDRVIRLAGAGTVRRFMQRKSITVQGSTSNVNRRANRRANSLTAVDDESSSTKEFSHKFKESLKSRLH
jgi:hypothetical protein